MRALALALVAACGDAPAMPADAAASVDTGPPPGFPAMLSVAATQGTLASSFTAAIHGAGTNPVGLGDVAIDANTGTMALGGTTGQVALYNRLPFAGYDIFGAVVVAPDAWSIAYPYCMDGMLVDIYAEPVGPGGFSLLAASGTCAAMDQPTPTAVALPAFAIATPPAFGHARVHGDQIELADGYGQIAIDGAMQPAVVFDTVDCSTSCGSPGWYELHTLIWDGARATFVIVYLRLGMTDRVQLSYALRLPTLDDPFHDATLAATWTGTAAARPHARHLPPPWRLAR